MMVKTYKLLKSLTALATLLLLAALAIKCLAIYASGMNGTDPIFTFEAVSSALLSFSPFLIVYVLLVFAAVFARAKVEDKAKLSRDFAKKSPSVIGKQSSQVPKKTQREKRCRESAERSVVFRQILIIGAAVVFLVFGVLNGGAKDVFIKAINICTECIGLG